MTHKPISQLSDEESKFSISHFAGVCLMYKPVCPGILPLITSLMRYTIPHPLTGLGGVAVRVLASNL